MAYNRPSIYICATYFFSSVTPLVMILEDVKGFATLESTPLKTAFLLVSFIAPILAYIFGVRPIEKVLNNALATKRLYRYWRECKKFDHQ